MLSLFPALYSYGQVAPFLLRLTLGAVLIYWAYGRMKSKKSPALISLGVLEGIVSILLVIGLYTQLAALVAAVVSFVQLIRKAQTKSLFTDGVNYYFILLVISLSVMLLGAGIFSIDLPL